MPVTASSRQMHANSTTAADPDASGGTLVTLDGRTLPLRSTRLSGRVRGGLGRVTLEQTFENPHAEPLRVTYQVPLPEDGAVSGFSFRVGDREIIGEVDRKDRARERFEQALAQGRSAAHLEQERTSVFTQEVGNIPPGATLVASIQIDQPLAWIDDPGRGTGGWEWRFPTVVAPRYLAESGRVPDAARVHVQVADRPRPVAMTMDLRIADVTVSDPSSPSHALILGRDGHVSFAAESVGLDRDVVVRWAVATPQIGLGLDVARPPSTHAEASHLFGLLTVVPPSIRPDAPIARDLVLLLDTSGSMDGEPLAQAKRVAHALIEGLAPRDTLELIEFSSAPRRFDDGPNAADSATKARARQWIASLRAGGGTEMVSGILSALDGIRAEAQRQVVVITDGLIGFERDVIAAILSRLPSGSRVHTVGVGSAVNRSLTAAAARAGRGVEVVIGLGEDPERATTRLLARTEAPLVVDLQLEGSALREHAPQRLPDLYAGSPALIPVKLVESGGELVLRGRTAGGVWEARATVRPADAVSGGPGVVARFGRERVEDLELSRTAGADAHTTDEAIVAIGLAYCIATRLTSWVAISDRIDVDPADPTRRESVPQEIPYGMSVEGLGLRQSQATRSLHVGPPMGLPPSPAPMGVSGFSADGASGGAPPPSSSKRKGRVHVRSILGRARAEAPAPPPAQHAARETAESDELAALDDQSEAEQYRGAAPAFDAESGGIDLFATLLSRNDGTWIFEVRITAPMRWDPAATIAITLADGTVVEGAIAPGSTRAGDVAGGTLVRLILRIQTDNPSAPTSLRVRTGGTSHTIRL